MPYTKQGFTLVELIVGIMLAVLVIGAAGSFLIFGTNLLNTTAARSQQQADVTNVSAHIAEELRLAQSVEIVVGQSLPATLAEGQRVLFIGDEDGLLGNTGYYYLQYGGKDTTPRNYYGTEWYNGYKVSLDFSVTVELDKPKSFSLTVSAFDRNGNNTSTSSSRAFSFVNVVGARQPFASNQINSENTPFYLLYTYGGSSQNQDPGTDPDPDPSPTPGQVVAVADGDTQPFGDRTVRWVVPQTGTYLLECWGANGGKVPDPYNANRGIGGYSAGEVHLVEGTVVYLTAGGAGEAPPSAPPFYYWPGGRLYMIPGGTNGGGDSAQMEDTHVSNMYGSGGGGSDVRVLENDLYHRIIVAGGGGGNGSGVTNNGGRECYEGGNGGGVTGESGHRAGRETTGGGQSSAGKNNNNPSITPGLGSGGGFHTFDGAGGGGGWYGGGAGISGAGGSGFVLTSSSVGNLPSGYFSGYANYYLSRGVNVQSGDDSFVNKPRESTGNGGYVRITFVA